MFTRINGTVYNELKLSEELEKELSSAKHDLEQCKKELTEAI